MRRQWEALSATVQDALVVAFAFVLGVGLYLSGLFEMASDLSTHPTLPVRIGVLALICVATFLRRRMPVLALGVGLIPFGLDIALGPTVPIWLIYSDLIYAGVLYATPTRSRLVVAVGGVLSVALTVLALVFGDWRIAVITIAALFAFVATPLWWALSVRGHKEIAEAERKRAQAMTLVAELDRRAAIADERKTMARDLHDVIAGHLSAIAIQSEAALGILARQDTDPAVAGIISSIRSNSVSAMQEMRTMIGLLRRDDGAEDDIAAPRKLAQLPILVDAARAAGITVRVADSLNGTPLPSAVDQAAYLIVQEALTNAMKHAPGQEVDIDVRTDTTALAVTVRNPTVPVRHRPAEEETRHSGLMNMRERAAALGGTFTAGPGPAGWEVLARLPISVVQPT
ncbi:histidine kinase [Nocardia sp. NBC_00565]|uniref:sensor histidine kinase n=1 Tax=Nocardia sp. NBC_00565 TaxID=2975993 RepID=UPI002E80B10A|nr:histidine kinase [Nocardia sp. NBC_00565]WUC07321.1 histidine kinase [Nocardia sp. NBC_00565]